MTDIQATPLRQKPFPSWLLVVLPLVFGVVVPVLMYAVAPAMGITAFQNLFSIKKLLALLALLVGGVVYWWAFSFVIRRPRWLVYFYIIGWPLLEYLNNVLLFYMSINLHLRPILLLSVGAPGGWLLLTHARQLLKGVPYLKYYLVFFAWLLLYFFFNNQQSIDPRLGATNVMAEGSVSVIQTTSYFYCLLGIAVAAVTTHKEENPARFFDGFNKALLVVSSLIALVSILCFPFGWLTLEVDGFLREMSIFTHPNPFAHHMGVVLLYQLGLFCFYQGDQQRRMPGWLLVAAIGLNLVVFLMALSKTAIFVFSMCTLLLFFMNLSTPGVRKSFVKALILMAILVPVGIYAYQIFADRSFLELFEARINQQQSLNWRVEVWTYILSKLDMMTVLLGNGLTSANGLVFQVSYNAITNPKPIMMVHNGYVALLYDLGLMGYLIFAAALSLMSHTLLFLFRATQTMVKPMLSTVVVLTVYFFAVCGFDEMTYMFDAPQQFWVFSTLLYTLVLKENGQW